MRVSVLKVGGSCLSSPAAASEVAERLAERIGGGERLVIVVSALKGVTDRLLEEATVRGITELAALDEHLAQGEIESARLLAEELRGRGVRVACVEPSSSAWPIVTTEVHGDADPLVEETEARVAQGLAPLIEAEVTPVVCGFLGKTREGEITTMGRGGSDATAVLLGRVLRAREVVLLKDVEGVHTSDPKRNSSAKMIKRIHAMEALRLAEKGAKVVQVKALKLKSADVPLLVVGNGSGKGTLIRGAVEDERRAGK